MDLKQLREQIDTIDDQLLRLLVGRMELSKQVAAYKTAHKLPVFHPGREQEILDKAAAAAGPYGDGMKVIFSTIMDISRANQHSLMGTGEALRQELTAAKTVNWAQFSGTIACPGVEGAYSSEAAGRMFPKGRLAYYAGFEDVFLAVKNGAADFGVIPVENSTAGSVHETYDLIMKYRFHIARGFDLPVHHCLAALPGAKRNELKKVYSHPQALSQCKQFLQENQLDSVPVSNTAVAAKYLKEQGDLTECAICSAHAAQVFGLQILEQDIQMQDTNTTRFIAITRDLILDETADKISLIFSIAHITGSLYRTLGRFAAFGLNLTKLESRPTKERDFSYVFYLDLVGNVHQKKILDLLCALSGELPYFVLLGNYKEESGALPAAQAFCTGKR